MQKEFIGVGFVTKIKEIIKERKPEKILLVTGKQSYINSGAKEKIENQLENIDRYYFSDFEINPKLEDIKTGVNLLKKNRCDLIIAVGGGSVIDVAKSINILAKHKENDLLGYIKGESEIEKKGLPLIAIPTTAGTGSEATHFSVVYVDKIKYSLAHKYMLPDYAIIDAALSYNLPKNIAASSGMDALSQAVESYWAVNSTEDSRDYAAQAIRTILKVLELAVSGDNQAKEEMSTAAHSAGKAINISKTTAPHALSYPITSEYGVPHGHAVALTLGYFFDINSNIIDYSIVDGRGYKHISEIMKNIFSMFECGSAEETRDKWFQLMFDLGLETNLNKLGIKIKSDIHKIVDKVNIERLSNNPVRIEKKDLILLLERGI